MNIDNIFFTIINQKFDEISNSIPVRDCRILQNLTKSLSNSQYITENQARLLIKIVNENIEQFTLVEPNIQDYINTLTWSKPFRPVDKTKKLTLDRSREETVLLIEFAFSSYIRKVVSGLIGSVSGLVQLETGKIYQAEFTEKNIVLLVETLSKLNFDIDETIRSYYRTIKSWVESEVRAQFLISEMTHPNFQKHIASDLGIDTPLTQNILNDRSMRYQYFTDKIDNPVTLTEIIASRSRTKIWVDSTIYDYKSLFDSLIELKRLPVLVVFDLWDSKKCVEELKKLSSTLDAVGINNGIGIYFRVANDGIKNEFNQIIADRKYNCTLDSSTRVAGVQNGKIPKFFLTNQWKPMSVISIGNSLKNNKTAVYSNCCDLIISYTDTKPLIDSRGI